MLFQSYFVVVYSWWWGKTGQFELSSPRLIFAVVRLVGLLCLLAHHMEMKQDSIFSLCFHIEVFALKAAAGYMKLDIIVRASGIEKDYRIPRNIL